MSLFMTKEQGFKQLELDYRTMCQAFCVYVYLWPLNWAMWIDLKKKPNQIDFVVSYMPIVTQRSQCYMGKIQAV